MTPADHLAGLLRRATGATVAAPRRVLCALLDALWKAELRAAARADELALAQWHMVNSLRDREDLARALDAADAREAALVRAVCDREGALLSVPTERVKRYLGARGWVFLGDVGGHGRVVVDLPAAGDCNYAGRLWGAAQVVGAVEGRHPTLVLAAWFTADAGGPGA